MGSTLDLLAPEPITSGRPDAVTTTRSFAGNRIESEEDRRLVQRVFLLAGEKSRQTVLFTSVDRQPDTGAICARAAEILAEQVDGSVCVIDADLRQPSLHHHFGAAADRGLADVLRDEKQGLVALQQRANLWFVPAGPPVVEAGALFRSTRGRTLFKELRNQFDHVLVHAAPLSNAGESVLLGQWTDGVVLVVQAHKTRRERARKVKQYLEVAQVPLLGVVLTNRRYPIPEFVYRWL